MRLNHTSISTAAGNLHRLKGTSINATFASNLLEMKPLRKRHVLDVQSFPRYPFLRDLLQKRVSRGALKYTSFSRYPFLRAFLQKRVSRGALKKHICNICLLSLITFHSMPVAASEMADEISSISIISDSSLALPMTDILLQYAKEKHKAVSASYQPPVQQEKEVSEGASYDVLITARTRLIDDLKLNGLVDIYSEAAIARNRLVLVAAANDNFQASIEKSFPSVEIITRYGGQPGLVLGNPETLLAGTVAREALRHYGVLEDLEPYTIYIKEMNEILSMVKEQGNLALIYESDAQDVPDLRIVAALPDNVHQAVVYTAVVLAGDRMDDARQFVDYLKQAQSQRVLSQYGFTKP